MSSGTQGKGVLTTRIEAVEEARRERKREQAMKIAAEVVRESPVGLGPRQEREIQKKTGMTAAQIVERMRQSSAGTERE